MSLILIRYGEMGLKSRSVRKRFENIFIDNIKDFFMRARLECIVGSDWGRIYLRTSKQEESIDVLRHIFGIVSVSPVIECSSDFNEIIKTATDYSTALLARDQAFAIRARRTGDHKYTSIEIAGKAGASVLGANKDKNVRVRLKKPDVEIHIEVRKNHAYIFSEVIQCEGGLPLGSQGKVASVFTENYERSSVSSWLMMKRGCRTHVCCANPDDAWVAELGKWDAHLPVHKTRSDPWKESAEIAKRTGADGLVTADSPETAGRLLAKEAGLPVFYPLIGLDDEEIAGMARNIKNVTARRAFSEINPIASQNIIPPFGDTRA